MRTNMKRTRASSRSGAILAGAVVVVALSLIGSGLIFGTEHATNPAASASTALPADVNNDGVVNISDLSLLLSKWGTTDAACDINDDGIVNISDLSVLLSKWGTTTPAGHPDASNTGVPTGTTLRSITAAYPDATAQGYSINAQGRVTITKDGGVYDGVLFPAGVWIKAKNITIRNSKFTGGRASFTNLPAEPTSWNECRTIRVAIEGGATYTTSVQLVDATYNTNANILIEDSEITVNDYSIYVNSYMGHDTTMRRVNISGGVDAIGIHNGGGPLANFRLEDSYLHDLYRGTWSVGNYNIDPSSGQRVYCGYDSAHPEATHNDGIQMHDGSGTYIVGNYINPKPVNHTQSNAGIMMNNAGDVHVDNNHFQYGLCSINMVTGLTLPIEVTNNTFYGNNGSNGSGTQGTGNCAIIRPAAAGYIFTNNRWQNGTAITLTNG